MENFKQIARFYDSVYSEKQYEMEAQKIIKMFDHSCSLVDIGCGTGKHLDYFAEYFDRTVGIEPSKEMGAAAVVNGHTIVQNKIENKGVVEGLGKFDIAVSMFDVFDYIFTDGDYADAMNNVNTLLKMNGHFYLEGWNADRMSKIFEQTRWRTFGFMEHEGIRVSTTTRKHDWFEVIFDYFWNGEHFSEKHVMKPRLTEKPDLSRFGFELITNEFDEHSVNAMFVKVKENHENKNPRC